MERRESLVTRRPDRLPPHCTVLSPHVLKAGGPACDRYPSIAESLRSGAFCEAWSSALGSLPLACRRHPGAPEASVAWEAHDPTERHSQIHLFSHSPLMGAVLRSDTWKDAARGLKNDGLPPAPRPLWQGWGSSPCHILHSLAPAPDPTSSHSAPCCSLLWHRLLRAPQATAYWPVPLGTLETPNLTSHLFFFLACVLGLHSRHMQVPRLGVESKLQLLAYTTVTATWDPSHVCNLHHSSQQRQILNPLSEARDRT